MSGSRTRFGGGDHALVSLVDGESVHLPAKRGRWNAPLHRLGRLAGLARSLQFGAETSAYPIEWSIDPQERIAFRPAPDGVYVLQGEYQKGPQILAADADTPEMPARHHALIVAMAMKKYAAAMAAPEVYAQARDIEAQHRAAA
jgi:hypothetical protein